MSCIREFCHHLRAVRQEPSPSGTSHPSQNEIKLSRLTKPLIFHRTKMSKVHIIPSEQPPGLTVEAALQTLRSSGGLKKTVKLSSNNMDVFRGSNDSLFPKDMAVQVIMDIQREKDTQLPHRKKLAEEVQETVKNELESVFRGGKETSDATLIVYILLLSDGSSKGSRWLTGVGRAKLTVAWLLVADQTGQVATGKQLYLTADCSPIASSEYELDHWEYTSAIVRSLARSACHQVSWYRIYRRLLHVLVRTRNT